MNILVLGTLLAWPVTGEAQNPTLNPTIEGDSLTGGFHDDRNYFSPEPWEHFDPVTGNVILTFTDLTLPANGGRSLQFQRTYNNADPLQLLSPQGPSRWTFGFPGMVMRVIEQPGQVGNPTDDLATILPRTPRLVMADGSEQSTVWIQRPNDLDGPTKQWVRSGQLFKYDLFHNELWMTDGTWCKYDDNGWLVLFTDPFGNAVQLDRQTTPGTLVVTQFLGTNGEQRVVTLSLDPGGRPERMEYLDRVWQYSYNGLPNAMSRDIETVTLPEGLHWSFAYEDGPLSDVTTPQMGHVAYNYEIRRIFNPQ